MSKRLKKTIWFCLFVLVAVFNLTVLGDKTLSVITVDNVHEEQVLTKNNPSIPSPASHQDYLASVALFTKGSAIVETVDHQAVQMKEGEKKTFHYDNYVEEIQLISAEPTSAKIKVDYYLEKTEFNKKVHAFFMYAMNILIAYIEVTAVAVVLEKISRWIRKWRGFLYQ